MRVNTTSSSASNSFCADCLISREYLTTWAGAFQAGCAVLLIRNALFLPARFRHKAVPKVLPDGPVSFQIDQDTDLAALLVSHVLDSAHGSIVLQMMAPAHCTCAVSPRTLLSDRMDILQLGRENRVAQRRQENHAPFFASWRLCEIICFFNTRSLERSRHVELQLRLGAELAEWRVLKNVLCEQLVARHFAMHYGGGQNAPMGAHGIVHRAVRVHHKGSLLARGNQANAQRQIIRRPDPQKPLQNTAQRRVVRKDGQRFLAALLLELQLRRRVGANAVLPGDF